MPQLLIELFSEEIPARMQSAAARDLARLMGGHLEEAGLAPRSLKTYAGPRRLTLVAEGLPLAQADRSEEKKGPRVGAPEQAIEGFLRSNGLRMSDLVERDGVYFVTTHQKGRPAAEVVAEALVEVIGAFPWPKSMNWGRGRLRWVRPLRRILCLLDGEVVPLEVEGLKSGDQSEGHRFMGAQGPFAVRDFEAYVSGLAERFVVLDAEERKRIILEEARRLCEAEGLDLIEDDGLLEEVCGLAEWPQPVLGRMNEAFLALPPEVIRTSMRTHQKYFAVRDPAAGKLAPRFVTVANIEARDGGAAIAAGNAKVLSGRLNDARFFWTEDQRPGAFDRWAEKLKGVTFHARLGALSERTLRIAYVARALAEACGADPDRCEQAGQLCKRDLVSLMVGEFPELQGIMGGYYAEAAGFNPQVVEAVRDHYRPQGPSDSTPKAAVSAALALADKVDTLVGFFAIGEKPTGSRDPFALRRAALGIIRILIEADVRVSIEALVRRWYESLLTFAAEDRAVFSSTDNWSGLAGVEATEPLAVREPYLKEFREGLFESGAQVVAVERRFDFQFDYGRKGPRAECRAEPIYSFRPGPDVFAEIAEFLADRLKVVLKDQGLRHDLVDAIFALGDDDIVRVVRRIEALAAFLETDDGANLLAGVRRAANLLRAEAKKHPHESHTGHVDRTLMRDPVENALADALVRAETETDAALRSEDFTGAMEAVARLRAPVDAFFEAVLVNDPEAEVRLNRLRLLSHITHTAGRVADFSLIAG